MFKKTFAMAPKALVLGSMMAGVAVAAGVSQSLYAGTELARHDEMKHTTGQFAGIKANKGSVTHATENGKQVLTLSDDFVVPDTPAPHWQVVDSQGNTYLLQRLVVKGDKLNKTIVLPGYIKDVAKVQIWCAYAEVLLGEASFEKPVM